MEKEQFGYAYQQFYKAFNTDTDNPVYLLNMGHAEKERGNLNESEIYYQQAWNLDLEDYTPPRALASLYYYNLDRKQKAHNILDKAIEADGVLDFQDFFCIYDKIQYYSLSNNKSGLRREMVRVKTIAINDEEKSFAGYMLSEYASMLYQYKVFDIAVEFLVTANALLPEDQDIRENLESTKKYAAIISGCGKIMERKRIHQFVKYMVSNMISYYFGDFDDEEWEEKMEEFKESVYNVMDTDPDNLQVKKSLKIIRNDFPKVFEIRHDLFTRLIDMPGANNFAEECPSCDGVVRIRKTYDSYSQIGGPGNYSCPHCSNGLYYDGSGYSSSNSSTEYGSSSSDDADWSWLWIVVLLIILSSGGC